MDNLLLVGDIKIAPQESVFIFLKDVDIFQEYPWFGF